MAEVTGDSSPVELPVSMHHEAGTSGLVIAEVEAGGAGDRAGLLVGDVLLALADEPLARAGDTADLRIMRGGRITAMEASLAESGRAA